MAPSTKRLGFWSATLATVFSIVYVIAQIAEWLGWLGSAGGPESSSTALGIFVLLTPSLLLGPAFLVLVVCIHEIAPKERKVWSRAAVAFATVYTTLVAINYYVQLAWVGPRLVRGDVAGLEPFLFKPFDSFLYAVDILGYSFMSLAALFAAPVFARTGRERFVRASLLATGWVLPFLIFQLYVHWFIWVASVWAVVFPAATWSLAVMFHRANAGDEEGVGH